MKWRIGLAIVGVVFFYSLTVKPTSGIQKAAWLVGTWENKTARGSIFETWTVFNETELRGKSYMLKNTDTVVFENVRLVEEQGTLYYIPTVNDQNNKQPVRFALKSITDSSMVFENLQHDFPQVISYIKVNEISLIAEISATKKKKERKQTFPMNRLN